MTPDQAVRHGARTVNSTVGFCMFGLPALSGLGAYMLGFDVEVAMGVAGLAFIPCWVLAWAAWSILVPRWRVWAYERVENLDALKQLAFERQLLWPDGHFFEKTEFRTALQRERIAALEAARRPSKA